MAVITISIDDNLNKQFRELVKKWEGEYKGALGKALEEAIAEWILEKQQKEIAERQIGLAKKGLYSLKGWKFNREDLHER